MSSKAGQVFPPSAPPLETKKAAGPQRLFAEIQPIKGLEPLVAAPVVPVHVHAAIAVTPMAHAALKPAVSPAFATTPTTVMMGQHDEPALLAVIERLVERVCRIGDLLQHRRPGRHVLSALAQASHGIIGRLLVLRFFLSLHPRGGALDSQ